MPSGSKVSVRISALPNIRLVNSQVTPPMWVKGNTSAARSSSMTARRRPMPRATAAIDASVCWAPFGSAVVPDV